MAPVGYHELAPERRARLRIEQDGPAIRTPYAPGDVMLEHEQVVQVVGRHEGGGAHVHEPALDTVERGVGAELGGVGDHFVPAESAGDDRPKQSGGWLDGERDRHGRRRWRGERWWRADEDAKPSRRAPFVIPEPRGIVTSRTLGGTGGAP
jgi:hypothetical protein